MEGFGSCEKMLVDKILVQMRVGEEQLTCWSFRQFILGTVERME